MNREMTYPEAFAAFHRTPIGPRFAAATHLIPSDDWEEYARGIVHAFYPHISDTLSFHQTAGMAMLLATQAKWERGGRVCWAVAPACAFALAMTEPPSWEVPTGRVVMEATGASCVYIHAPEILSAEGPEGQALSIVGAYVYDGAERTTIEIVAKVEGDATQTSSIPCFLEDVWTGRLKSSIAACTTRDNAERMALLVANLLIALKHTRIVEKRTETFPPLKNPGKQKIEARRGKTRAPITRIRLEVGTPMGTVQERAAREAPTDGGGGSARAGHWVRGHWHRFWTGTPETTDKPDATRPSKHVTLHRVVRWVRPYYTGDAVPVSPRVKVELYKGAT